MFIELVDALRCPVPHEESWLVASATRMEARHIVDGLLGCPVCQAQYPIRNGVADFRRSESRLDSPATGSPPGTPRGNAASAMRLAAFLGLSDALGFAVLLDEWGAEASALRELVETPLLLVDPPPGTEGEPGVSVVLSDGVPPLAAGAARATAIATSSAERVAAAVRITRAGGRVVAPATVALPAGVRELARDETLWVGEKETAVSPLVTLHVRRG
jgi:uncharacterized protein YbaR (Trm112 family)